MAFYARSRLALRGDREIQLQSTAWALKKESRLVYGLHPVLGVMVSLSI